MPLDDGAGRRDYADLALHLGLPLLVVARAHLGTLNHSFLTVHYARARGVRVLGVVLNGLDASLEDPSTPTNPRLVAEMCGVPVWGVLPRLPEDPSVEACAGLVRDHLELSMLYRSLDLGPAPRQGPSEGDSP